MSSSVALTIARSARASRGRPGRLGVLVSFGMVDPYETDEFRK
jgi:hypothetical protein